MRGWWLALWAFLGVAFGFVLALYGPFVVGASFGPPDTGGDEALGRAVSHASHAASTRVVVGTFIVIAAAAMVLGWLRAFAGPYDVVAFTGAMGLLWMATMYEGLATWSVWPAFLLPWVLLVVDLPAHHRIALLPYQWLASLFFLDTLDDSAVATMPLAFLGTLHVVLVWATLPPGRLRFLPLALGATMGLVGVAFTGWFLVTEPSARRVGALAVPLALLLTIAALATWPRLRNVRLPTLVASLAPSTQPWVTLTGLSRSFVLVLTAALTASLLAAMAAPAAASPQIELEGIPILAAIVVATMLARAGRAGTPEFAIWIAATLAFLLPYFTPTDKAWHFLPLLVAPFVLMPFAHLARQRLGCLLLLVAGIGQWLVVDPGLLTLTLAAAAVLALSAWSWTRSLTGAERATYAFVLLTAALQMLVLAGGDGRLPPAGLYAAAGVVGALGLAAMPWPAWNILPIAPREPAPTMRRA